MNLLIKKATVIEKGNPLNGQIVDIEITNGIITEINSSIALKENFTLIEKENLHVSLGWIETQAVFGEPGHETTETIENGLKTAALSGFTNVFIHSNTTPAIDNQTIVKFIQNQANYSSSSAHIIGAFTKNSEGNELADLYDMYKAGAIAFGDYKKSTTNANLFKIGLQYTSNFGAPLFALCINKDIKGKGFVHEGIVSTKLGMKGIPAIAEEIELIRNLTLLEYTGGKLHIPTLSTKNAVKIIKNAKAKGLQVTCGVSVNNVVLTDEILTDFDSNTKLIPPVRDEEHRLALIAGLKDGTIDVITSDHCPVDVEQKIVEYDLADYGSIGFESIFGALQTVLPTELIIEKLTFARDLFLTKNTITVGNQAVLSLFNPEGESKFEEKKILSFSKNSVFINKTVKGSVYGSINGNKMELK